MKYIIEETASVSYLHEIEADSKEEARKKFYDNEGVNYNIQDPYYGNDIDLDIYTEEEWNS